VEKIGRVDHHHAGGAAIRVAVGQPKERHPVSQKRGTQ
jgi:hypothetical protein